MYNATDTIMVLHHCLSDKHLSVLEHVHVLLALRVHLPAIEISYGSHYMYIDPAGYIEDRIYIHIALTCNC